MTDLLATFVSRLLESGRQQVHPSMSPNVSHLRTWFSIKTAHGIGSGSDKVAPMTDMNDYQRLASTTAKYPAHTGLVYTVLGMASEAGEVAGKLKKAIRDEGGEISPERREQLLSEVGDVLWYVAMVAMELGSSLSAVAEANLDKLLDRDTRGVIGGDGDTR